MDANAFSTAVIDIVRGFLERELDPIADRLEAVGARIDAVERRFDAAEPDVTEADLAAVKSDVESVCAALAETKAAIPVVNNHGADPDAVAALAETLSQMRADLPTLVKSAVDALPVPAPGKDADPEVTAALVREEVAKAVAGIKLPDPLPAPELPDIGKMVADEVSKLPPAAPGKDADPAAVAAIVREGLAEDIAGMQAAIGAAIGMATETVTAQAAEVAEIKAALPGMVREEVAALPPAAPGKSVEPEAVAKMVRAEAERILDGWERPQDGKGVSVEDMAPVVAEAVRKAVDALPKPKDGLPGVGLAGSMIDRDGNLVVTLSDGTLQPLGPVVGKDVDMVQVEHRLKAMFDAWPKPKDGQDALGFEDLDLVETEAGAFLRFSRGDVVKDFRLPIVVDRGVFKEGGAYRKGDGVTWGGSFWIAQRDTTAKPDSPDSGWRLAVKKGRDGKDVVVRELKPAEPVKPPKKD